MRKFFPHSFSVVSRHGTTPVPRDFLNFSLQFSRLARRQWQPTPVLLPGKSHGWRSLEGCSPWGRWGSDTTEGLHFHASLSRTGEGDGNPLQCSCLENPRDGRAWWAAIYGVTQSRTQLKWLSSNSSVYQIGEEYTKVENQLTENPEPQELGLVFLCSLNNQVVWFLLSVDGYVYMNMHVCI